MLIPFYCSPVETNFELRGSHNKAMKASTYFIKDAAGFVKIGVSDDPLKRLYGLQVSNPMLLTMLAVFKGDHEKKFHLNFERSRVRGEWFNFDRGIARFLADHLWDEDSLWFPTQIVAHPKKNLEANCSFCGEALTPDDSFFEIYGVTPTIGAPGGVSYAYPASVPTDDVSVLFTHERCGPDCGYAFPFRDLHSNWHRQLGEKTWWNHKIGSLLAMARNLYFQGGASA